jgi:hypothetical protein
MAFDLSSVRRSDTPKPPRITIYGVAGVGKTSFAAQAPKPIFIPVEDGLGTLDVDHFPLVQTLDDVFSAFAALASETHDYQTVVVDSLDWLEQKVWAQVCRDNKWTSISEPGYGRGYAAALDQWKVYLDGIDYLRTHKGMTILQIAHSDTVKFESPETEPYSRYTLKLHKLASPLISEHSDVLGFVNYRTSTVKTETGFKKSVVRGVGSGERVMYLSERPAYTAKQRYNLPDSIPLSWDALAEHIPYFHATNAKKEAA